MCAEGVKRLKASEQALRVEKTALAHRVADLEARLAAAEERAAAASTLVVHQPDNGRLGDVVSERLLQIELKMEEEGKETLKAVAAAAIKEQEAAERQLAVCGAQVESALADAEAVRQELEVVRVGSEQAVRDLQEATQRLAESTAGKMELQGRLTEMTKIAIRMRDKLLTLQRESAGAIAAQQELRSEVAECRAKIQASERRLAGHTETLEACKRELRGMQEQARDARLAHEHELASVRWQLDAEKRRQADDARAAKAEIESLRAQVAAECCVVGTPGPSALQAKLKLQPQSQHLATRAGHLKSAVPARPAAVPPTAHTVALPRQPVEGGKQEAVQPDGDQVEAALVQTCNKTLRLQQVPGPSTTPLSEISLTRVFEPRLGACREVSRAAAAAAAVAAEEEEEGEIFDHGHNDHAETRGRRLGGARRLWIVDEKPEGGTEGGGPGPAEEDQDGDEEKGVYKVTWSRRRGTEKATRDRECKEVLAVYERGVDVFAHMTPPQMRMPGLQTPEGDFESLTALERAECLYELHCQLGSSSLALARELVFSTFQRHAPNDGSWPLSAETCNKSPATMTGDAKASARRAMLLAHETAALHCREGEDLAHKTAATAPDRQHASTRASSDSDGDESECSLQVPGGLGPACSGRWDGWPSLHPRGGLSSQASFRNLVNMFPASFRHRIDSFLQVGTSWATAVVWWCGGVAVVWWCGNGVVVWQWCGGVAVVWWCGSGVVVWQWCGDQSG